MRNYSMRLILFWLFLSAATVSAAAQTAATGRMTLASEQPQSVLHEPVYLTLSLRNETPEVMTFDLGLNHEVALSLSVVTPGGETIRTPKRLGNDDLGTDPGVSVGVPGKVSLPPGETYTQRVLVNKWYEFPAPGRYEIKIGIDAPLRTKSGQAVTPAGSGSTTLLLRQRDAAYLQRLTMMLAEVAVSGAGVEPRREAAIALSYVHDPVAIPSLVRVLQNGNLIAEYGIVGLLRVGGAEAADALIQSLGRTTDARLLALTKIALQRIEGEVTDKALKGRIHAAVQPDK